jgi:oligosaccharide repeat unit polymerase
MLGYGGLILGFITPLGRRVGEKIASRLPVWNWTPEQVLKPAFLLLLIGLAYTILAFSSGILGYQKVEEIGRFDGLILVLSSFWFQASFILWIVIFRSKKLTLVHFGVIAILLSTAFGKSAFQGNRGSLISVFMLIAFAYVCSGKKIGPKQTVAGGVLITLALIVGMIYGTTFRSIKTNQELMGMEEYAGIVGDTVTSITDQDFITNLGTGFEALAARLDSITPLAVVVSNYEKLGPYEEAYGLSNNIWNETVVFMVPRFIWPEKPVPTSPEKYADLYFNFPNNSFTLTPMGDLLRNFGPWGVPLGMIFVGMILRMIYSALRENQPFSFARASLFYMLLTSVSYEGSFGLIIPVLFKLMVIAVLGILIIRFFAGPGQRESLGEMAE